MTAGVDRLLERHAKLVLPQRDTYRRFLKVLPFFAELADEAVITEPGKNSNDIWSSYRYFPVIALTLSDDPKSAKHGGILLRGNQKAKHKGKICAEKRLLGRAQKNKATIIPGIFLSAIGDIDQIADVSGGRRRTTLPPCLDCSGMFEDIQYKQKIRFNDELPIVTSIFGRPGYQVTTPRELQSFYRDKPVAQSFHRLMPDFDNWNERVELYDGWIRRAGAAALTGVVQSRILHAAIVAPRYSFDDVRAINGWQDVLAA